MARGRYPTLPVIAEVQLSLLGRPNHRVAIGSLATEFIELVIVRDHRTPEGAKSDKQGQARRKRWAVVGTSRRKLESSCSIHFFLIIRSSLIDDRSLKSYLIARDICCTTARSFEFVSTDIQQPQHSGKRS